MIVGVPVVMVMTMWMPVMMAMVVAAAAASGGGLCRVEGDVSVSHGGIANPEAAPESSGYSGAISSLGAHMRIGELAKAAGMDVDTVRFYEKSGLLPAPARGDNNYRHYDRGALQRLRFIANCRALDMSLDEIRVLLAHMDQPGADCSAVDAVVAEHLGHVRERIAALQLLERQLTLLQSSCQHAGSGELCGIVLALGEARPADAPPARGVHSR